MRPGPCEYGVFSVRCGADAVTGRQRPNNQGRWRVCQYHAEFLDRLQANVTRHRVLLERLAQK